TTKKAGKKDTTPKTPPKDGKDSKDAGKKVDNALVGKGVDPGKSPPKGNDAGSRSVDKSTTGGNKDSGARSARDAGTEKSKPKIVVDPPKVRPAGLPSNPGVASTPRGGSIVATMPQIGTERWERVHRHRWRHDWDWAHRFWGPDYGTGNTF